MYRTRDCPAVTDYSVRVRNYREDTDAGTCPLLINDMIPKEMHASDENLMNGTMIMYDVKQQIVHQLHVRGNRDLPSQKMMYRILLNGGRMTSTKLLPGKFLAKSRQTYRK